MILLLSPSKTLDLESAPRIATHTMPEFLDESKALISRLRTYSPAKLGKLMDISDKLTALNVQRYKDFATPFTPANARPAIMTFKGDVYEGIEVESYSKDDFAFAQKHIRILSGLYGLLRPLDLMQPYRLEMGIRLPNPRGKDLYQFWGDRITQAINREKDGLIVNLASEEYFKAVRPARLEGELITIVFKENQKGKLKIIGLFAKQARGLMANYVVRNRLSSAKDLKKFKENGYGFEKNLSDDKTYIFVR